ncbi:MAG: RNA polymerase sigma-70 factor [Cyclobacteriaceae bacterium]|nr:RNA polymerase sigma-70 factor [Cyclobacteriaceae bacterium]
MRPFKEYSDKDLILMLKSHKAESAFDELYIRYFPRLMSFARTFIYNKQEAEESVQEIFLKIWERKDQIDENRNFKSYLFQSVKHHLYSVLRKKVNEFDIDDLTEEQLAVFDDTNLEAMAEDMEKLAGELIDKLPETQKKVFLLSRLEGRSNDEISLMLNISKRTVEHHIYLALRSLKMHVKSNLKGHTGLLFLLFWL